MPFMIQLQGCTVVKRTHVSKNNFKINQHFCFLRNPEEIQSLLAIPIKKISFLPFSNTLPKAVFLKILPPKITLVHINTVLSSSPILFSQISSQKL